MNEIRITASLSLDEEHPEDAYIDFNLSVDGQYLHDIGVYIDPVALVNSTVMSGEFFIFTCDCGNPSCLGIDDGVNVAHLGDTIRWRLRNPISWPPDEPMPEWSHDGEFLFAKDLYVEQVAVALDHAKRLVRNYRPENTLWAGPGLSTQGLLALEIPEHPGFIMPEPGEQVVH